eukprot:CAMPEP_0115565330 /NCGR_PEP_ID=MMETSP0271-20121206/103012_1 /TAXON_ID=71861 /ORGANISM="Scrippsiella trochoidea, Strain CCMP3099" /LENGTH=52 /DNA_ID=CAMNT_0002999601 /DNA_START=93 /DNA_END=247 /DNA_ORIENTATION=-
MNHRRPGKAGWAAEYFNLFEARLPAPIRLTAAVATDAAWIAVVEVKPQVDST